MSATRAAVVGSTGVVRFIIVAGLQNIVKPFKDELRVSHEMVRGKSILGQGNGNTLKLGDEREHSLMNT